MARGKHGAATETRRQIEDLENRLAGALLAESRAKEERQRMAAVMEASTTVWEAERRDLVAERDGATSPRVAELQALLGEARATVDELRRTIRQKGERFDKLFLRFVDHLKTEHRMSGIEATEFLMEHFHGAAGKTLVNGVHPSRRGGEIADPDMARVVQRARGLRS